MRFLIAAITACCFSSALACTGLELQAKDGTYINGRTVEFGINLAPSIAVIPRNYDFNGTLPDGSNGLHYRSKYAATGLVAFGAPPILDGLNEKGLSVGAFYFPGYASYTSVTSKNKTQALSPADFPNWVLTQFATVDEVKNNLKNIVIAPTSLKQWGGVPPFHYIVYDASGKSIVIEPINGQLQVMNNPIGVITNSPNFQWHLTNLSNYINLSANNATPQTVGSYKLINFGQGSGMLGLPGDFTPPSRFVRAAFFVTTAMPTDTADQTVFQVFHVLNQFDIPKGVVRQPGANNTFAADYTLITSVKDPKNEKFYFKTYDDQTIKMVNLAQMDPNASAIKLWNTTSTQSVVDVTGMVK